jgi:hypothetical protein
MRLGLRIALFCLIAVIAVAIAYAGNDHFALAATTILPIAAQKNKRLRHIGTIAPSAFPQSVRFALPRDFVYNRIILRLTANVTVASGTSSGTLFSEQPWSLIRNIRLETAAAARSTIAELRNMDFAAMARLQSFFAGTPCDVAKLANGDAQSATAISCAVEVPFYLPRTVNPRICALNTHELNSLDLVLDFGSISADLISGGDRTLTLANVQVQILAEEFMDAQSNAQKYAVNLARYIEFSAPAANTAFPVDLKRGFITRGVLLKQFTRASGVTAHTPVDTVINGLSVVVNGVPKLQYPSNGVSCSGWKALQAQNKSVYGLEIIPTGYAIMDFAEDGMLDGLMRSSDFSSIGLSLDINTVSDSVIRVYPLEIVDRNQ